MLFMLKSFVFLINFIKYLDTGIVDFESYILSFIRNTNIKIVIFLIKIFKFCFFIFLKKIKKILKKIYII
jgi:hypothetical protein